MTNPIVRHETCDNCKADIPIREYAAYNDDGYTRITRNAQRVSIGHCCWNKLLGSHIQWGESGWEWRAVGKLHKSGDCYHAI